MAGGIDKNQVGGWDTWGFSCPCLHSILSTSFAFSLFIEEWTGTGDEKDTQANCLLPTQHSQVTSMLHRRGAKGVPLPGCRPSWQRVAETPPAGVSNATWEGQPGVLFQEAILRSHLSLKESVGINKSWLLWCGKGAW